MLTNIGEEGKVKHTECPDGARKVAEFHTHVGGPFPELFSLGDIIGCGFTIAENPSQAPIIVCLGYAKPVVYDGIALLTLNIRCARFRYERLVKPDVTDTIKKLLDIENRGHLTKEELDEYIVWLNKELFENCPPPSRREPITGDAVWTRIVLVGVEKPQNSP